MSSNEKDSIFWGDSKQEVVTTPFSEKKSSTKDVEKGTDKLADMLLMEKKYLTKDFDKGTDEFADIKQAVKTFAVRVQISLRVNLEDLRDGLNLILGFFKQLFLKVIQSSIKNCLKIIFNIKIWNCIKRLLYRLIQT